MTAPGKVVLMAEGLGRDLQVELARRGWNARPLPRAGESMEEWTSAACLLLSAEWTDKKGYLPRFDPIAGKIPWLFLGKWSWRNIGRQLGYCMATGDRWRFLAEGHTAVEIATVVERARRVPSAPATKRRLVHQVGLFILLGCSLGLDIAARLSSAMREPAQALAEVLGLGGMAWMVVLMAPRCDLGKTRSAIRGLRWVPARVLVLWALLTLWWFDLAANLLRRGFAAW